MRNQQRTGVFLVRAWWEDGRFRARVTSCQDITSDTEPELRALVGDPEDVGRRLAGWLDEFEQTDEAD